MKTFIPAKPGQGATEKWMKKLTDTREDETETKWRILLIGKAGAGKNFLIGTFPNVLWLDYDKGLATIAEKDKQDVIPFSRGEVIRLQIMSILTNLRDKTGPFAPDGPLAHIETLGLDGYTKMADFLYAEIDKVVQASVKAGKTKPNPYASYGFLRQQLAEITEILQDISKHTHVVATCGITIDDDKMDSNISLYRPGILGGYRDLIAHAYDEVWHMYNKRVGTVLKYYTATRSYGQYDFLKTKRNFKDVEENLNYSKIIKAKLTTEE